MAEADDLPTWTWVSGNAPSGAPGSDPPPSDTPPRRRRRWRRLALVVVVLVIFGALGYGVAWLVVG